MSSSFRLLGLAVPLRQQRHRLLRRPCHRIPAGRHLFQGALQEVRHHLRQPVRPHLLHALSLGRLPPRLRRRAPPIHCSSARITPTPSTSHFPFTTPDHSTAPPVRHGA